MKGDNMNTQKYSPYPVNLVEDIIHDTITPAEVKVLNENPEIIKRTLKTLDKKYRDILISRYRDSKTLNAIGVDYGVSGNRIHQIVAKALRMLRHPRRLRFIYVMLQMDTVDECCLAAFKKLLKLDETSDQIKILNIITKNGDIAGFVKDNKFAQMLVLSDNVSTLFWSLKNFDTSGWRKDASTEIRDLDFTVRTFNCLNRADIYTVNDLLTLIQEDPNDLLNIRNFGVRCAKEVLHKLIEIGYENEIPEELHHFI
jgi:hypothetical protein